MSKSLILSIIATIWLCACSQSNKSTIGKIAIAPETADAAKDEAKLPPLSPDLDKYIYTDTLYPSSTGKGIRIQNSFPKGGSIESNGKQYIDASGKTYAFAVFWTRIVNETTTAITFNINFPADSFAIFASPEAYLKLFLPTDTLTLDKISSYNYGLTEIKSFLDTNLNKATELQKTILPNEAHLFYVATLAYQAGGTPRAAMFLKEQDLYYSISIAPHGAATIPTGKIN